MTATPFIAIIGSGMGAIGAEHRFRSEGFESVMFDKGSHPGGHTRTHHYEGGWSFDEGPHVSFTSDPRVKEIFAESVSGEFLTLRANVDNYWKGHRIKHPAQCNLHGLPDDVVVACLRDFIEVSRHEPKPVSDYEEWLRESFGDTFAETFPMEYARKVHTTEARNLTTDWLGPRLYRPTLEEVLKGAVSPATDDFHYVKEYRYPAEGGFEAYLEPFLERADLRLDHELVEVDPKNRSLGFRNGTSIPYDHLVSTVPLPDFIPMIRGVPQEVLDAAAKLTATELVLVNVGIDRDDVGDTWTYFYDQDIVFTRVSYPSRLSPSMAPPGCGSFQAEIYFSRKYRPLTDPIASFIEPTITDLRRCGLIRDGDAILHRSALHVPYANIIHDHDKLPSLEIVHSFIEECGIQTCGRYGSWGYQWTDEAFVTGEKAAGKVLESLTSAPSRR